MDQGLRDTLLDVRTSSEGALENARREADLILREAELKAEQYLVEGRAKRKALSEELLQLNRQREGFIARFKHLIESQRELLEVLAQDSGLTTETQDTPPVTDTTQTQQHQPSEEETRE